MRKRLILLIATFLIIPGCLNPTTQNVYNTKIGVVIGDSIAEGYPQYGRLQPNGQPIFDPNYPDSPGQFSSEFSQHYGFAWLNHGINSQTSTDIWVRWRRDALAENYNPNDGRGSKTLPQKPYAILVHAGVNDYFHGINADITKANFLSMVQSANENKIKIVFCNIPPRNDYPSEQILIVKSLNQWMSQELVKDGAIVIDEYSWAEDPLNPGKVNPSFHCDGVHPNTLGYQDLSKLIFAQLDPVLK